MKVPKIGITGGIGSGKTTACKIFETLGIPIFYADDAAKIVMVENAILRQQIIEIFGNESYINNDKIEYVLNRKHISSIAFSNPEKLAALNAVVHPAVRAAAAEWHTKQINAPYTLQEAALHYESGGYKLFDAMITVFAPLEMRIQRAILRGDGTRAEIEARIAKQMSDDEKVKRADFVIYNDGAQLLIPQILDIHTKIKSAIFHKKEESN